MISFVLRIGISVSGHSKRVLLRYRHAKRKGSGRCVRYFYCSKALFLILLTNTWLAVDVKITYHVLLFFIIFICHPSRHKATLCNVLVVELTQSAQIKVILCQAKEELEFFRSEVNVWILGAKCACGPASLCLCSETIPSYSSVVVFNVVDREIMKYRHNNHM